MNGIAFTELSCQRCGGGLTERNGAYVCAHCGKKWRVENFSEFNDMLEACGEALRRQRAADIANLRRLLWTETHREFVSNIEVSRLCGEILKYLPKDFYANFYLATCNKNKSALGDFLITVDPAERYDDIGLVSDYLLKALKPEWVMSVGSFIEKIKDTDVSLYNKYRTEFEAECEKIEECIFEPTFPRDVFIAYSSADMAKVIELVNVLESEKLSCFVSARNMRHGSGSADNYENILRTAIDHCGVILFVSSDNSRSVRCDAYKELDYVNKNQPKKPRVEYVIQNYSGRATERFFEEFFSGLEYCTSAKDAAARVCGIILRGKRLGESEEQVNYAEREQPQSRAQTVKNQQILDAADCQMDENGCLLKYFGTDKDIIIPETVKFIGSNAFANCTLITSISLPNSVTSIGEKAFYNCSSLKEINLPDSLISIGACAFHTCRSLTSITIPKGVTKIGSSLFGNCESLKKIYCLANTIPSGWARNSFNKWDIACGAKVLWGCESNPDLSCFEMDGDELTRYIGVGGEAVVPCVVSKISENAFGGCNTITGVTISNGVFTIGEFAFRSCTALKSVTISESVNSIGDYAFYGCASLEGFTVNSNNKIFSAKNLDLYAGKTFDKKKPNQYKTYVLLRYASGKTVTRFTLPTEAEEIADGAFSHAKTLKSVTLHKKLTAIGGRAFIGCSSLESIEIPKSVTTMGENAFKDCPSLKTIYCRARKKPEGWNENWLGGCGAKVVWGYNPFLRGLTRAIKWLYKLIKNNT